jgi:hypothetical protein
MSQSDRTDDPESPSQRQRTTAPAPMYDVDVPRASWFEHLFGFREEEAKGELLHERLELRGDMLHSRVNGASYAAGVFFDVRNTNTRDCTQRVAVFPGVSASTLPIGLEILPGRSRAFA